MSASHVLIVPLIATIIVGGIILVLAGMVTYAKMKLIHAQDKMVSRVYQDMVTQARRNDDLMCELIGAIEKAPSTAGILLDTTVQQAIYDAHSAYRDLGVHMKGIK